MAATNEAPRFRPPFGGAEIGVIHPTDHKGYYNIVAWCIALGATSRDFVIGECERAAADSAPLDAVYKHSVAPHERDKEAEAPWVVVADIASPDNRARVERYANAMVDHEKRLAEWHTARKKLPPLHSYTLTLPATVTVTVRAASLQAAAVALAPVDGQLHHEVKQVAPAFGGTMRLQLNRDAADLVATDDPEHKAPPAPERRMPLGT